MGRLKKFSDVDGDEIKITVKPHKHNKHVHDRKVLQQAQKLHRLGIQVIITDGTYEYDHNGMCTTPMAAADE